MTLSSLKSSFTRIVGTPGHDILDVEAFANDNFISTEAQTEAYGLGGNDDILSTAIAGSENFDWETDYTPGDEASLTATATNFVDTGSGNNIVDALARATVHFGRDGTARNEIVAGPGRADIIATAEALQLGWPSGVDSSEILFSATNTITTGLSNDIIDAWAIAEAQDDAARTEAINTINSGSGHDAIYAVAESQFGIVATTRNEINSGTGNDIIYAVADNLSTPSAGEGGGSTNAINAGAGDDDVTAFASGVTATNWVNAGSGNDFVVVDAAVTGFIALGPAKNTVLAGAGDDRVEATASSVTTDGINWAENDLRGGDGHDILEGYVYGSGLNRLDGGTGNDELYAELIAFDALGWPDSGGANELYGGSGDDFLFSTATGNSPNTFITSTLDGGVGDDVLFAYSDIPPYADWGERYAYAEQLLLGGHGDDFLFASLTQDTPGSSHLSGGDGDDILIVQGGLGNVLDGGAGDDTLYAGAGTDLLLGGTGSDTFVIDPWLTQSPDYWPALDARATIGDFDGGEDTLAFFGFADTGETGLADDLDAAATIFDFEAGGDVVAVFDNYGSTLIFEGAGTGAITSFADLVDDPLTQLVSWDAFA